MPILSSQGWKRRLVFGLLSIPAVVGGYVLALRWVPYGVAVIATGVVAGLFIAFAAQALWSRTSISTDRRSPASERPSGAGNAKSGLCAASPIRQRLAQEQGRLEHLDAERERRGDSGFGKATEDQIVWGELLELELQDIDEQVRRICDVGSGATGRRPRTSSAPNTHLRKGGPHEHNGA